MPRVVLDTDVASLSYKGRLPASLAVRLVGQEICVTFVTIRELSRWTEKRRWGTRARTELVDWLGRAVVLPYDERVAWKWGQLSVEAERRGRTRPLNDTWILRGGVCIRGLCGLHGLDATAETAETAKGNIPS